MSEIALIAALCGSIVLVWTSLWLWRAGRTDARGVVAPAAMLFGGLLIGGAIGDVLRAFRPTDSSAIGVVAAQARALPAPSVSGDTALSDLAQYAAKLPQSRPAGALGRDAPGLGAPGQELASVDAMIARLAARLKTTPADTDGWRMLGWSYMQTEQAAKAVDAYQKAAELSPTPAMKSALGEAMVARDGGSVSEGARKLFDEVLAGEADNARARYHRGVAREAAGDFKGAVEDWRIAMRAPPPDARWSAGLAGKIDDLARRAETGVVTALLPKTASDPMSTGGTVAEPGPTAADVSAAAALPADQRAQMIRGMVEGLAKKLSVTPRDESGWLRLLRSRMVLRESEAARGDLARALAAFADDADARRRIQAAAADLGVTVP